MSQILPVVFSRHEPLPPDLVTNDGPAKTSLWRVGCPRGQRNSAGDEGQPLPRIMLASPPSNLRPPALQDPPTLMTDLLVYFLPLLI